MPFTDICIYFIIAILGMAYPISLQALTKLDEKYSSVNILNLFNKERICKLFNLSLYISLIYVLYFIIWKNNFKPECVNESVCYFLSDYLLILVATSLVFFFLLYSNKIFVYSSAYRLTEYLKNRKENDEFQYFNSIADIYYLSIRLQDSTLSQTIHSHFYQLFREIRNANGKNEIVYPIAFYQMVYNALIEVGELNSKKLINISLNIASGRYYLGTHEYTHISQQTYDWLWNNLRFISETQNDELAFEYWKNSHQFFSSAIPHINIKTDGKDLLQYLNKEEVDQREREREKFYEFHFAMGGMLLYAQRYKLINRIFRHTMSIPPNYVLLPSTMTTVFSLFIRFMDIDNNMFPYRYQFYGMDGISGEGLSQNWICKYIVLMLLRQYTVTSYYYGLNPVEIPHLPSSRKEKKNWLECMDYLKSCIKDIQGEKELMITTGFGIITDSWCDERNILYPQKLVDEVIDKLKVKLESQEIEQEVSPKKVKEFYEKSGVITKNRINTFISLINSEIFDKDYEITLINGAVDLIKKEAFVEEQGVTYTDFDTRLASKLSTKITSVITAGLSSHIKNSYVFKGADLFKAIEYLKPDPEIYILLNLGIHIPSVNQISKIEGLSEVAFKEISIVNVPFFERSIIRSSFLLLKRQSLPNFKFNDLPANEIEKLSLEQIDNSISLYGSVIDLNKHPQFQKLFNNVNRDTLSKSLMLKLALNMEILWPKTSNIIELKLYSEFYQDGIPNKIEDLKIL